MHYTDGSRQGWAAHRAPGMSRLASASPRSFWAFLGGEVWVKGLRCVIRSSCFFPWGVTWQSNQNQSAYYVPGSTVQFQGSSSGKTSQGRRRKTLSPRVPRGLLVPPRRQQATKHMFVKHLEGMGLAPPRGQGRADGARLLRPWAESLCGVHSWPPSLIMTEAF